MTEQQQHLIQLLEKRSEIQSQIENIQNNANLTRELLWKVQGAIEYLTETGVTLPEAKSQEETVEETVEE